MPRSLDWGCLSKAAVERVVERAATREVLPLSTWPKTPTLTLYRLCGCGMVGRACCLGKNKLFEKIAFQHLHKSDLNVQNVSAIRPNHNRLEHQVKRRDINEFPKISF